LTPSALAIAPLYKLKYKIPHIDALGVSVARFSTELQRHFFEEGRSPTVTLLDILELAGERTFGFLFVLLALPSALPVPAPGYSVPFGITILLLSIQLIMGRKRPWLPERIKKQSIPLKQFQGFLEKGLPWLRRIEGISRPRLSYVCSSLTGRTVIGLAISLMAVSMLIPIPLTNTLPAIGIFVTGFGLLDDDGAISLAGLTLCLMGLALTTSILAFGYTAVSAAISWFKSWIFTFGQ
jgi:hypothetical protein